MACKQKISNQHIISLTRARKSLSLILLEMLEAGF